MNGHYEERIWEGSLTAYPPLARLRRGFKYRAFVPATIAERSWSIPDHVTEDIVSAETAIRRLDAAPHVAGIEALSRLLLRAESISSSQIEGLVVSQRRLAQALYDPALADRVANEVVANIHAMERAIRFGAEKSRITVFDLCQIHARLMTGFAGEEHVGSLRQEQNWIGGRLPAPLDAEYIPPPPEAVPALMEDLVGFIARDDLPAVFQAAIAHAQFETIHPFVDGNGRVGRALIHLILRRRGAIERALPPLSNVLLARGDRYIAGLTGYREGDDAGWTSFFANSAQTAAHRAAQLGRAVEELQRDWLRRLGDVRRDATVRRLIEILPATPVLDAKGAAQRDGSSVVSARAALMRLQDVGALRLLRQDARRGRVWVADELLGILNAFEWDLADEGNAGDPRRTPRVTKKSLQRYLGDASRSTVDP